MPVHHAGRNVDILVTTQPAHGHFRPLLPLIAALRQGGHEVELAPPGMRIGTHELNDLPMFNADLESIGDPEPVRRLEEAIATSDALLIATPEHNRCVPGVLKNAIDWASRPPRQSVLTNRRHAVPVTGSCREWPFRIAGARPAGRRRS